MNHILFTNSHGEKKNISNFRVQNEMNNSIANFGFVYCFAFEVSSDNVLTELVNMN